MTDTFLSIFEVLRATLENGREFSGNLRAEAALIIMKKYKKQVNLSPLRNEIADFELANFDMCKGMDINNRTSGTDARNYLYDLWTAADNIPVITVIKQALENCEDLKIPLDLIKLEFLSDKVYHLPNAKINTTSFSTVRTKSGKKTVPNNLETILSNHHASMSEEMPIPPNTLLNSTVTDELAKLETKFNQSLKAYAKKSDLTNLTNFAYVDAKFTDVDARIANVLIEAKNLIKIESEKMFEDTKNQVVETLKKEQDFSNIEKIQDNIRIRVEEECKIELDKRSEFTLEERYGLAQANYSAYIEYKNAVIQAKGRGVVQLVLVDPNLWHHDVENDEFQIDIPEILKRLGAKSLNSVPGKKTRLSKMNNLVLTARISGNSSAFQPTMKFISDLIHDRFSLDRIHISLCMPEEYNISPVLNRWKMDLKLLHKYVIKPQGFYLLILNDGVGPNEPNYDHRCSTLNVINPRELVKLREPTIAALQSLALGTHFVYKGELIEYPAEFSKINLKNRMHYDEYVPIDRVDRPKRERNQANKNQFKLKEQTPNKLTNILPELSSVDIQNIAVKHIDASDPVNTPVTTTVPNLDAFNSGFRAGNEQEIAKMNRQNNSTELNNKHNHNRGHTTQVHYSNNSSNNPNSINRDQHREEFFQGSGHSNAMNYNQRYRDNTPEVQRDPNTAYGMQRLPEHPFQNDNRIPKHQHENRSRCDSGTSEKWEYKTNNGNQQNNSQNSYQNNSSQVHVNARNNRPGFAKF